MKDFIIKNWVSVVLVVFLLFILIFDKNGLPKRWKLNREISSLKSQKQYYIDKINSDSVMLENLKDNAFLERFARERYLMKKPEETIYIVK